jgi:hypothetical protein
MACPEYSEGVLSRTWEVLLVEYRDNGNQNNLSCHVPRALFWIVERMDIGRVKLARRHVPCGYRTSSF